jgi:hypothetical protein
MSSSGPHEQRHAGVADSPARGGVFVGQLRGELAGGRLTTARCDRRE